MGNPELYAEHVAKWMNEMAADRVDGSKGASAISSKSPKEADRKLKSRSVLPQGVTPSIDAPSSGPAHQTAIPVQHHGR